MAAFLGLFVLGTIWWWILTVGFFIWIMCTVEKESWFWSVVCVVAYILFFQFLGKTDLFGHLARNPIAVLGFILLYFAVGFMWSFLKWWLFVNTVAEKRREARKNFIEGYREPYSSIPLSDKQKYKGENPEAASRMKVDWETVVVRKRLEKPAVKNNKSKISLWVIYWPASLIWSLLDDLVHKIIKQLVIYFRKIYEAITNVAFKNVE
jgi:hypothetical protein